MYDQLVYYIYRDGLIKIGYTGSYDSRMRGLRPDAILAVRHGDELEEADTQTLFKLHRVYFDRPRGAPGREWFHPGPDLVEHIAAVRRECGVPPRVMRKRPVSLPHHTRECGRGSTMFITWVAEQRAQRR